MANSCPSQRNRHRNPSMDDQFGASNPDQSILTSHNWQTTPRFKRIVKKPIVRSTVRIFVNHNVRSKVKMHFMDYSQMKESCSSHHDSSSGQVHQPTSAMAVSLGFDRDSLWLIVKNLRFFVTQSNHALVKATMTGQFGGSKSWNHVQLIVCQTRKRFHDQLLVESGSSISYFGPELPDYRCDPNLYQGHDVAFPSS